MQRESNKLVFRLCMRVEAIIPVDKMSTGFPWLVFLMTLGGHGQKSRREK